MIRELHEVVVPQLGRENEVAIVQFLGQMTRESVPVFAVPNAGPNMQAVTEWFRPMLSNQYDLEMDEKPLGAARIAATTQPILGEVGEHPGDKVVHIDGKPGEPLSYNLHLTTAGKGTAYFYEPAPEFYGKFGRMEFGIRSLLDKGLVDDTVFKPERHVAHLGIGTLVIFRSTGQVPLAHDFRTLAAPRLAEITRITPKVIL